MSVFLIDLGNSSPSRPWKVVNSESCFTSLAVIHGKSYQEVDDLTSGIYLIAIMSGMNALDPLNSQQGSRLVKGRPYFIRIPASCSPRRCHGSQNLSISARNETRINWI
ncbi:hypothetical protein CAEBREN_15700 [Caenorhabditis brenneri]|uniref:Protein kinase domain-containing protein n=1 Tax=Caenorhabditis brenneri TaxID=135651 RepID=G0NZC5_CAEBE|nr:hypothetical protein CAEBREN_15700 [Caenorhabditis brenneri]